MGQEPLGYNTKPASLLPRNISCCVERLLRIDVVLLMDECNATWSAPREIVGAVCEQEALVTHTGGWCLGLRLYIARKPNATGINLYVLADNRWGYVFHDYLYKGCRGKVRCLVSFCPKYYSKGTMRLWVPIILLSALLCAESFFGSHGSAKPFAAHRRGFLMLSKRDKQHAGVTSATPLTHEGDVARAVLVNKDYEIAVCKNPKVGHKHPRLVAFFSNCW